MKICLEWMKGFTTEFVTANMNSTSCNHKGIMVLEEILSYSSHRNMTEYGVQPTRKYDGRKISECLQKSLKRWKRVTLSKNFFCKEVNFFFSTSLNPLLWSCLSLYLFISSALYLTVSYMEEGSHSKECFRSIFNHNCFSNSFFPLFNPLYLICTFTNSIKLEDTRVKKDESVEKFDLPRHFSLALFLRWNLYSYFLSSMSNGLNLIDPILILFVEPFDDPIKTRE